MTTRTSLAVLLLTGVLAALSWGCADALPSGDSDSHGPLLDKLRRVSRSPQLPNAGEIAEKARDLAKTARDMAQQHISERTRRSPDPDILETIGDALSGIGDTLGSMAKTVGVDLPFGSSSDDDSAGQDDHGGQRHDSMANGPSILEALG